jgi:coenzyme F420-reducing hydrogenase delta subunit
LADSTARTARHNVVIFECTAQSTDRAAAKTSERLPFVVQGVRVPCSGKLQPEHLLKAFEAGADMVVVLTCGNGDCRYLEGPRRIKRRIEYVCGLLDDIGLGGRRLLLLDRSDDLSTSDGWSALIEACDLTPNPLGADKRREGLA